MKILQLLIATSGIYAALTWTSTQLALPYFQSHLKIRPFRWVAPLRLWCLYPPASFLCLWICLEFPVDRVSRVPSFSPSLACVATIFPERSCKECLSPEHSGMEALGGTRGSLLYLPWTLPPGHYHLLFSFFKVCNVIHSSQRSVDLKCSDTLLSWISYYWLIALFYNCVDTVLCMKWNGFTFDMKVSKIFLSAHYSLLWGILLFFSPLCH